MCRVQDYCSFITIECPTDVNIASSIIALTMDILLRARDTNIGQILLWL
jgi:hypothetical protein